MYRAALFVVVAGIVAIPALAQGPSPADLRSGRCAVQQVHTPAGKTVHSASIVRCAVDRSEIADREKPVARPDAAPTGRD